VAEICIDEDGDPDMDGVPSGAEVAYSTNPLVADTDSDGTDDGAEWGDDKTGPPLDSDGDSKPDVLESGAADFDSDCIPDELDPDDEHASSGADEQLKALVCPKNGVCEALWQAMGVACIGGVPVCTPPSDPAYELAESRCDGLDNDCDGETDEGMYYGPYLLGTACVAPGQCGTGTVECRPDTMVAVCSTGPGGSEQRSQDETCDGLDNDCDGATDEDQAWNGVALGELCTGTGECGDGMVECRPDVELPLCSTMPGGTADESGQEACDALDNDCDGATDEQLFSPDLAACPHTGVCQVHADQLKVACLFGTWICDPSAVEGFHPGREMLCDALDNDCDGSTDEEFKLQDLDGAVRAIGASCGVGPCSGGTTVCGEGGLSATCTTWGAISQEGCDGVDNDCDGQADEGMEYNGKVLGEPCTGVGLCGSGTVECSAATGQATCSSNPDGSASDADTEACDLQDNDCDGETDEDAVAASDPCAQVGVCEDAVGVAACIGGEWQCNYSFIPEWEAQELKCDGLDNDCDGWADEQQPKAFSASDVETVALAPPGRTAFAWTVAPGADMLFVSGGAAHPFPWAGKTACLSDIWGLDLSAGTWTRLPHGPLEGRSGHTLTWAPQDGTLLLIGGRCDDGPFLPPWRVHPFEGIFEQIVLPAAVSDRHAHAAFLSFESGEVFVVGGKNADGPAPSYVVSPDMTMSLPLPDAPQVSSAAWCQNPLTGLAYMFGGERADGSVSADFFVFDPIALSFTTVELPYEPAARKLATLGCAAESVTLFGGVGESGDLLADTWKYDLSNGMWQKDGDGPPPRSNAVAAEVADGLLLTLGVGADGRFLDDGWLLQQGAWTDVSEPGPGPLAAAASTLDPIGRRFCVAGGFAGGAKRPLPGMGLWCYGLEDHKWQKLSNLGKPSVFGTLSFDPNANRLLLLGSGLFPDGGEPQVLSPVCAFDAFDVAKGTWSQAGSCEQPAAAGPGAISAHAAAVRWKDLSLWIYGGIRWDGLSSRLYRYGLDTGEWEEMKTDPPLPARYGHAIWIREEDGDMIVAGGASGGTSMFIIDLNALTWSEVVDAPGLGLGFPVLAYDSVPGTALLLQSDNGAATQVMLSGDLLSGLSTMPFEADVPPVNLAASCFDPWQRSVARYGGIGVNGIAVLAFHVFHTACK